MEHTTTAAVPIWRRWLINRKTYTILYGAAGCIYSASNRYFNATISTLEKRFKIPSKNIGFISAGNDISQTIAAVALTYLVAGKNKPRWMSYALYGIAMYCFVSALPHFIYGPGDDALRLTKEYGEDWMLNTTELIVLKEKRKLLCNANETLAPSCNPEGGDLLPQIILFVAQLLFGVGESIYFVFGLTYLDDNSNRARTPMMISVSYFLKMLGPAIGFALGSVTLAQYVAPNLTPTVTKEDPRWIGAWWLGWPILAIALTVAGLFMRQFPENLTREGPYDDGSIQKVTPIKKKNKEIIVGNGRFRVKRVSNFNVDTNIELVPLKSNEKCENEIEVKNETENETNSEMKNGTDQINPKNETVKIETLVNDTVKNETEDKQTSENGIPEEEEPSSNTRLITCQELFVNETVKNETSENESPNKSENQTDISTASITTDLSLIESAQISKPSNEPIVKLSTEDFKESLYRLLRNKILMLNIFSTTFYLFGGTAFFMFATKYTEIQYLVSPSRASTLVGTNGLVYGSVGVLLAGFVITLYKPRARILTGYNVLVSTMSIIGFVAIYYAGCEANDNLLTITPAPHNCHCEYVKYAPVCGSDNRTYISACHAGCSEADKSGRDKLFFNCSLIKRRDGLEESGSAIPGTCPIDCKNELWFFLVIIYIKKFLGASGITSNFLVGLRCVEKRDKPLSIGLMLMLTSLISFVPGPIIIGHLLDSTCLVWGKTCSRKGNCWVYNIERMRFFFNVAPAIAIGIGTLLDCGVWYYSKNLNVFEEEKPKEPDTVKNSTTL